MMNEKDKRKTSPESNSALIIRTGVSNDFRQ
jgi:hypothetical protein